MQKNSTRVFIVASILFGFFGLLLVLTSPGPGAQSSLVNITFMKLLVATGFVVLSSFALSVAGKYLKS